MQFYGVRVGRKTGVYESWAECQAHVTGYPHALYHAFSTRREAEDYVALGIVASATRAARLRLGANVVVADGEVIDNVCGCCGRAIVDGSGFAIRYSEQRAVQERKNVPQPKPSVSLNASNWVYSAESPFVARSMAPPYKSAMVVYTDGSCVGNGGRGAVGGIGVHFPSHPSADISERLNTHTHGRATNQRAELYAVLYALQKLATMPGVVEIHTDSMYVVNTLCEWMPLWTRTRKSPAAIANHDVISRIFEAAAARGPSGFVAVEHVRGHAGDPGNTAADALARAATGF